MSGPEPTGGAVSGPEPTGGASPRSDVDASAAAPPRDAGAPAAVDRAVAELNEAATRLRRDDLDGEQAAALVERCADLATELGAALEREARAARAEPGPGQETLL